jgi:hypothetical protein
MRVSADVASAQVKGVRDFGKIPLERGAIMVYNLHKE